MITEEILKAAGYRRYPKHQLLHEYCDYFYQKTIKDGYGKAYHIAFWHYPEKAHPSGDSLPESWLFELSLNEPHSTFEIHRPDDLEFCERKAMEFWIMMGGIYYERDETTTTV